MPHAEAIMGYLAQRALKFDPTVLYAGYSSRFKIIDRSRETKSLYYQSERAGGAAITQRLARPLGVAPSAADAPTTRRDRERVSHIMDIAPVRLTHVTWHTSRVRPLVGR